MRLATCIAALSLVLFPLAAAAADNGNFGGNGVAWVEVIMGTGTYYDQTRVDNLSKDWETPDGEVRFTQPGSAEGKAADNSAIRPYPCPGTQVYPGSNRAQ